MNKDDEWIPFDKVKRDINRAMVLTVEVERCQELNARGEECFADNDIAKAEEYFTQADEALEKMDSEIYSLEIPGLVDEEYQAQARTSLGLARCCASKVPEYSWRDEKSVVNEKTDDHAIRSELTDAEELFDDSLEFGEDFESEDMLEIKAMALLGRAKVRDRIFEYDCTSGCGGGEEDYSDPEYGRQWPDKEYETVMQFLRPLAETNSDRFEPILLDGMTALARWKRLNCDITNNIAIFGSGEFEPEDLRAKLSESFDTLAEVSVRRRKLAERDPEKHRAALIDAVNEMVEHVSEGGPGFGKYGQEFVMYQLAALEPEVRSGVSVATALAGKNPARFLALRKRAESSLAKVKEVLSGKGMECLPDLLWRSPQFAEREIWDGTCVKKGSELPPMELQDDELVAPACRWKLPMLIASKPELMEKKSVRESFEGLVKVDAEGHYADSWESSVLLAKTWELFGSVNPWAYLLMFRPELSGFGVDFAKFNGYSACRLLARQPAFTEKWNLAELADEKSPFWQGSPHSDYVTAWQELVDLQPQFAKWREA